LDETVKTYIEELLTDFRGFHQIVFSFLTAHSLQQLFSQLTSHNSFFHSHSPTKQTLSLRSSSTLSRSSTFSSWVADMERADAWGSMWQPGKGMRTFLLQVLSTIPEKTKDVGRNKGEGAWIKDNIGYRN
jgi:hypothetical protein